MAQQKESEQALQTLFKDVLKIDRNTLEGRMLADVNAVSSPLANKMLGQIGLGKETTAPFALLDNGAGLGVVGAELQRLVDNTVLAKSSIICGDFSEAMVQATRRRAQREGWVNTEARVINAETTGFPDNHFDYVTMNIGAHVVPDSEAWLKETIRIVKPGGIMGFTTWHERSAGWASDMRAAFESFPFAAPFVERMQTTKWGNWSSPTWVKRTLEDQPGLEDVKVDVLSHLQHIRHAEEFVTGTFEMMIKWVINSDWSEELRREHGLEEVKRLVKEYLEKKYEGRGCELTWTSIIASARKAE